MIPMFEQYPLLKGRIPHVSLGQFPTPIKHLSQLGKEIGPDYIYLKHDGLSGPIYGGNKIRKLEFLLGDALTPCPTEFLRTRQHPYNLDFKETIVFSLKASFLSTSGCYLYTWFLP